MTVRLREVIEVPRPIEEAFAFVADFANAGHWDPSVERSERVGGPDGVSASGGVGAEYRLMIQFDGRSLSMIYRIVTFEPPRRVVLNGSSPTVRALDDISFESTPAGGTRITYVADLTMRHVLRLLEPRMKPGFERMGRDALAGMRAALQAGP